MTGEHLEKRIKAAQLTKKELAARMNVVPQSVQSMLKYKSVGSDKLEDVCRAIGKPINFLYEGYEDDAFTVKEAKPLPEILKSSGSENAVVLTLLEIIKAKDAEFSEARNKYDENMKEKDQEIKRLNSQVANLSRQLYNIPAFEKTEMRQVASEP